MSMAEGGTSRHWESKRRDVKRAQARLTLGLRSLEGARLYYLNTMTREQQRLREELLRLQKSCSKPKFSTGPEHTHSKATFPLPLSLAVQNPGGFHETGLRSQRKTLPKTGDVAWTKQPSSLHPWKVSSGVIAGCEGKRKGHLPPLEAKDPNVVDDRDMSILKDFMAKQLNISAESVEQRANIVEEQGKDAAKEEPRDSQANETMTVTKPTNLPENRRPSLNRERLIMDPEAYAADGRLRTMYNRPDFLKSYGEVRRARYIRHKGIPAWEKELSVQDIFGHKTPTGHSSKGTDVAKAKP